ncbi:MAG TPA: DsrE family protein [Gammaproteobacteria bacterium]|nr:DsrE family protein [Gammaproteobacteria bacterium]
MHRLIILAALATALLAFIYSDQLGMELAPVPESVTAADGKTPDAINLPERAVLDITVHTVEELQVLFERAETLAQTPRVKEDNARVVLVLHGPEVEFFSTRNYDRYREIVDRAAHLDALDIVDVVICQTMMAARGIARDDIPPFIEQVPVGTVEVERLLGEGYVYF